MKTSVNFNKFCKLVEKYVYNKVSEEDLHQMYIDWKTELKVGYKETATEFIIYYFEDFNLNTDFNSLKRNINKKDKQTI